MTRACRHAGLLLVVLGLVLLGLAALAWPEQTRPLRYFDSAQFSSWEPFAARAESGEGGRKPPTYPLFLRVVGRGPPLVHAQTWISLACWCFLGWTVARTGGVLIAGLFALSPLIRPWNLAMLSESLSLSLLAALLALSLLLRRPRPSRPTTLAWWAVLVAFATVRDAHLLVLPVAALALLPHRWPAPSREWRRFADGAFVLALLLAVGLYAVERHRRTLVPAYTALTIHVFPDPAASAALLAKGMPDTQYPMSEELETWIVEGGRSAYGRWVLSQPGAYVEGARWLAPANATSGLWRRYFTDRLEPEPRWADVAAVLAVRLSNPPAWLWGLALLAPLWEWRRFGAVSSTGLMPAILAATAYGLAFASYWGAGTEALRHGLVAIVLYHVTFALGLAAWIDVARRPAPGR